MVAAIEQFVGDLETAEPREVGRLRIVPLVGKSRRKPAYQLLSKQNKESVTVSEIDENGSVPFLLVINEHDRRVFIMDGEQLIGAKQNRILNTDVLVPAHSKVRIPVSCVEAGRWGYLSRTFTSSGSASYHVRRSKMDRVHRSLKEKRGHDADQSAVWADVGTSMEHSGHRSPTSAMNDAYLADREKLREAKRGLKLPVGTIGFRIGRIEVENDRSVFERADVGVERSPLVRDQDDRALGGERLGQLDDRIDGAAQPADPFR